MLLDNETIYIYKLPDGQKVKFVFEGKEFDSVVELEDCKKLTDKQKESLIELAEVVRAMNEYVEEEEDLY